MIVVLSQGCAANFGEGEKIARILSRKSEVTFTFPEANNAAKANSASANAEANVANAAKVDADANANIANANAAGTVANANVADANAKANSADANANAAGIAANANVADANAEANAASAEANAARAAKANSADANANVAGTAAKANTVSADVNAARAAKVDADANANIANANAAGTVANAEANAASAAKANSADANAKANSADANANAAGIAANANVASAANANAASAAKANSADANANVAGTAANANVADANAKANVADANAEANAAGIAANANVASAAKVNADANANTEANVAAAPEAFFLNVCTVKGNAGALKLLRKTVSAYPHVPIYITGCAPKDFREEAIKVTDKITFTSLKEISSAFEDDEQKRFPVGTGNDSTSTSSVTLARNDDKNSSPLSPWTEGIGSTKNTRVDSIARLYPALVAGGSKKTAKSQSSTSNNSPATNKASPSSANKVLRESPYVGIVNIEEGCLDACAFCSTHLVKGRLHSFVPQAIVDQVQALVDDGCLEIQLTGQDCACYGFDIGTNLAELTQRILTHVSGNYRIRLGMGNPRHVLGYQEALLDCFTDERIYKFIHIPVQSGSENVLKAMNRRHTARDYATLAHAFNERFSKFTLSTDLIVGYPGESAADFNDTLELLKETRPTVCNITRFVARPGTVAARLEATAVVPDSVKHERSAILAEAFQQIALENNRNWIGDECTVVTEKPGYREGTTIARNTAYRPVALQGSFPAGTTLRVCIKDAEPFALIADV